MHAEIRRAAERQEVESPERCFILEVGNDPGDELVSIARARVLPGVTTRWHRLTGVTERYVIAAGTGRVDLEGLEAAVVTAGDVVRIPPGIAQRITNIGPEDLVFYCVCTPRYRPDCYTALE
jgi:mannose-6-phosphate isomerase-like protein (cupin superfamily)